MARELLPSRLRIERYTAVKLNLFVANTVNGQIVIAGNGISPIELNLVTVSIMIGFFFQFDHTPSIELIHMTVEATIAIIHHAL